MRATREIYLTLGRCLQGNGVRSRDGKRPCLRQDHRAAEVFFHRPGYGRSRKHGAWNGRDCYRMSIGGRLRLRQRPKSLAALFSRQATDSIQPGCEDIVSIGGEPLRMSLRCQIPRINAIRAKDKDGCLRSQAGSFRGTGRGNRWLTQRLDLPLMAASVRDRSGINIGDRLGDSWPQHQNTAENQALWRRG